MSTDVTEPQPPPTASSEDAEALLDTANNASQHVAVLHVAFMALCAYVLVIVFGTTDMDLLIGKGVKLPVPVVDVTVPIVGFYAFAPYLVVLVHFNLLLQLQLLSRKLYNFDTAVVKEEERLGGLRDRLHILPYFPYTYYLVESSSDRTWGASAPAQAPRGCYRTAAGPGSPGLGDGLTGHGSVEQQETDEDIRVDDVALRRRHRGGRSVALGPVLLTERL